MGNNKKSALQLWVIGLIIIIMVISVISIDLWQKGTFDHNGKDNEDIENILNVDKPNSNNKTKDNDADGINDQDDRYNYGNIGINIGITKYYGEREWDEVYIPDPYFIIKVDTDEAPIDWDETYDTGWDEAVTSEIYYNQNDIYDDEKPFVDITIDIADDHSKLLFRIEARDSDFLSYNDIIDYCKGEDLQWSTYEYSIPNIYEETNDFSEHKDPFTKSGIDDGSDEGVDCYLEFYVKIIILD